MAKKDTDLKAYDYGEDAGGGFEGTSTDDFMIPWMGVLQSGSPEVKKINPNYIQGAREGMLIDTVERRVFDGEEEGLPLIPCYTSHEYVEWIKRDDGGGFVGAYDASSAIVREVIEQNGTSFGVLNMQNGHDLVETFTLFALIEVDKTFSPYLISFSSSMIKEYKKFMTMARKVIIKTPRGQISPPLYAHRYRLKTEPRMNDQGSWFVMTLKFDGENAADCRLAPDNDEFVMARGFKDEARGGNVRKSQRVGEGQSVTPLPAGEVDPDEMF